MSIGIFGLKRDQCTISECIPLRFPISKYIPKLSLMNASVHELGSDHGGKIALFFLINQFTH